MKAISEVFKQSLYKASIAICAAAPAIAAHAQNSIPVLPSVNVRLSTTGVNLSNPTTFNSASLNLSCPASGITAIVSSTPDGTGKVLVDNFIDLTVTPGSSAPVGPVNLCGPDLPTGNPSSCFNPTYMAQSAGSQLNGQDPDGAIAASGGVGPFDIHASLAPGLNQVKFDLVDFGGLVTATSIYLDTNCTSNGVNGGGQISGNPIPSTNPPPNLLVQDFTFNTGLNKTVQQVLDYSFAENANTLILANGTIPTVTDQAIDPKLWPQYVAGTSFATSQCLVHFGELLDSQPACKLYTVTCQVGQGAASSGAQCPSSTARNIVIEDVFDGPDFFLPDIQVGNESFHQGFGSLMASEGWTGGPCTFDPASQQPFSCPENLLTLFTGPGLTRGHSTPQPNINSAFISIGPVPEWHTSVTFSHWAHNKWANSHEVQATFWTKPPIVPPPNNNFVAAPLYGVTYGVSLASALPSTEFPVPGDNTILNPDGCPSTAPAARFEPAPVPIKVDEDGVYVVHYFATDCAGTEELYFLKDPTGSWITTFYTARLFVDTVRPRVTAGPILKPAPTYIHGVLGYARGQRVTATYQCTDDFSGVELCGDRYYNNPVNHPPAFTVFVDTSRPGTKMFRVPVRDAAQNNGRTESVAYTVVAR